jgi:hypothetical protein
MSLTKVRDRMIDARVVNIRDFGAVGDYNTDTETGTDDTSAIQAAIDHCFTTGQTLYLPAGNYRITSTLDFFSNETSGNFTMPYKIEGEGLQTAFYYEGNGTALSFVNQTTRKSCYYGTIQGGFYVGNKGTGTIGAHFKGLTRWNMSSAHIISSSFSDKCIWFESNDGKGGLWNQLGYFHAICNGSSTDYGFFMSTTTNANHILKIYSNGDCNEANIVLDGSRNVIGQVGVDSVSDICESAVRISGSCECVITGLEIEISSSGNSNFVAGLEVLDGGKVTVLNPTFVGAQPRYSTAGTSYLFMLPQEDSDNDALTNGYSEIVTNNGLVIDNPLLFGVAEFDTFTTTTIGVSGTYSAYQTVIGLRHAAGGRGTRHLRSLKITNGTNQSIDIQIRNRNASGSVGSNDLIYTIASAGTQEISGHDLSFIIGDYATDTANEIVARLRTSASSFTGDVDIDYGSTNF